MAVQMQFDWNLLKPEKELTEAQQSLAREICETFLDTGAGIPGHQKKVQLRKDRNLLNELTQLGLIRNNANQYYPTFQALYYCRPGLRDSYAGVLDLILKAIKALYESPSGPRQYGIKQVEQQMSLLVSTSAAEDIVQALKTDVHFARATLFLKDFTRLVSVQDSNAPNTPVDAVVATDDILDYEDLQQAWREELADRPGQRQNAIQPKPEQYMTGEDVGAPPPAITTSQEMPATATPDVVPLSHLRDFSVSSTTRNIFNYAIQIAIKRSPSPQPVTSSALLFAMVELGRRQSQEVTTCRFLQKWISEKDEPAYLSAYKGYIAEPGRTYPNGSELMSSNSLALLQRASEIAEQTSESTKIHARHLLGALFVYQPSRTDRLKARQRLARMGFDLPLLRQDFRTYLGNTQTDDLGVWEKILSTGDETSRSESSGPSIQHGPSTHVSRDRWTTIDSLDHFPYAYAIYRFLTDGATQPPLAISIQAPWGGGKTSLMRMIQAQLDPEAAERAESIKKHDKQDAPRATVANVENEIKKGGALTNFAIPQKHENAKRRVTVWFNTWKYESTEQVWAGLADAIVQQVGERLGPVKRELFWFKLHLRRLDAARVRQRILRGITTRFLADIVPWLAGYVGGPLLSLLIILSGDLTGWAKLRGFGLAALVGTGLTDLIAAAIQVRKASSEVKKEPAATNLGDLVAAPDYSANLGFVHEVVDDLRRVFEIVPNDLLPMVIFIDDLDRCSPKKVAAVVEAINLFLAGEFPDCMFILGIDDEMVAAALDEAHSGVIARLPGYAKSSSIGWRFMDKFVQLPFVIPPSGVDELKKYLDSLFPHSNSGHPIGIEMRDRAARVIEANETTKPVDQIIKEVSSGHPLAASQETTLKKEVRIIQQMQENIETFTDDEDGVKDLIAAEAQKYFTNPRDLKRFVNLFRFYYFLRAAREARNERVATIEQMLRWIILSLKWPEVVRWLRRATHNDESRGLTVLEKLGHGCDNVGEWRDGIQNELGLTADKTPWLSDEALLQFFRVESALTQLDRLSMCGGRGLW